MSRRLRLHDDRGSALIVILAVTGILSLLVTVSFTTARRAIVIADAEEETHASLAAADAGLDDYLFRLNSLDQYWVYGDPADPVDPKPAPPDGNLAFAQFVPIPGGETPGLEDIGMFTYRVDDSQLETSGTLLLTAIGCAPGPCDLDAPSDAQRFRTVQATIKQDSFLDYLYFTDLETLSPVAYSTDADQRRAERDCSRRRWQQERPSFCVEIYWGGRDVVNGPFHTNDRFRLNGNATWNGPTSSSDPRTPPYDANGNTTQLNGGPVQYRLPLEMPPSNQQIRTEADTITNPGARGCMFTGPTSILLRADGKVQVTSPYTKRSGPGCGSWSSAIDPPRVIDLPANGVIYVQSIPANTSDPNYRATCNAGNGNGLGYPIAGDLTTYDCRAGDAFIEGTLDGRLTVAADSNVIITWHLDYAGTDDMLGLIANDFVQVYHPVRAIGGGRFANADARPTHTAPFREPRINAAILSVSNSFLVQQWNRGHRLSGGSYVCDPLGALHINGAIAQIYRGPVGTGGGTAVCTGYDKDYVYDQRLRFSNPPSFIDPVEATWGTARYAEQFNGSP